MTGQRAYQPPLDEPDQAEAEELADLIQEVRSRPGIAGSDTLAAAIIEAGWRRTPKEKP
jgi:hypothetical protein